MNRIVVGYGFRGTAKDFELSRIVFESQEKADQAVAKLQEYLQACIVLKAQLDLVKSGKIPALCTQEVEKHYDQQIKTLGTTRSTLEAAKLEFVIVYSGRALDRCYRETQDFKSCRTWSYDFHAEVGEDCTHCRSNKTVWSCSPFLFCGLYCKRKCSKCGFGTRTQSHIAENGNALCGSTLGSSTKLEWNDDPCVDCLHKKMEETNVKMESDWRTGYALPEDQYAF